MNIIQTTNSKGVTTTATENGTVIMQSAHLEMDEATCGQCFAPYDDSEGVSAYLSGPVFCGKDCAIDALDDDAQAAYEEEGASCLAWFKCLETDVLVALLDLIRSDPWGRAYDDEVCEVLDERDFDFEAVR